MVNAAQVAEEQSAKFLDENFGQLDLSGCPSCLQPQPESASLPDERFAPLDNRGVGLGAVALKRGIEEMVYDPETQARVAQETGNPKLLRDFQQDQAENVAREFRRMNPSYYRCPENWQLLVECLAYNFLGWEPDEIDDRNEAQEELIKRGYFTLSNLTAAFRSLSLAGSLETDPDQPRNLTEHERRAIAIQASSDLEGAVIRYLQKRLPEDVVDELTQMFDTTEAFDRIADPEYKEIVEEACWFAFEHGRPGYSPTPERRRFMREYCAGRIPTVRLLDEAWAKCQAAENDAMRASLFEQVKPQAESKPPDLDNLDDAQIDNLYHGTLQQIARDSRKPVSSGLQYIVTR